MHNKVKSILYWLDENLLFVLTAFLWVFIPLYPKLPLFDAIPGYIVKVRLEDVLIIFTAIIWLVQFLRGKISFISKTIFFWLILAYAVVGIFSILSGIFLLQTIPMQALHIGKSGLTFFRYLEYFSLFIFAFSSIKTKKHLKIMTYLTVFIVLAIFVYGVGQKYSQLPVYSTMNREFSKGEALQLGEQARVQSTFGGHYDMAAYLVITLPFLFALTLSVKKLFAKSILLVAQLGGLWLLFVGASKTSFIAYAIANLAVFIFYLRSKGFSFKRVFKYALLSIPAFVMLAGALFVVNPDMAQKLTNVSRRLPLVGSAIERLAPANSSENSPPDDFYLNEPIFEEVVTVLPSGEKQIELREKEFEFSRNAMKYGLSMGIRLDTLWPQAITGFRRNIFLGAGYGNLNKGGLSEFTESDSTDNNFLRVIGEIGLVGFVIFFGLIILIWKTVRKIETKDEFTLPLKIGYLGATIGLLINALYIDVFAASKVAFTFWAISGIALKSYYIDNKKEANQLDTNRFSTAKKFIKKHWPLIVTFIVFALLTYRNPYMEQKSLTVKFNYDDNNYKFLTLAKCIANDNLWGLCREGRVTQTTIIPVYSLFISPVFKVLNNPHAFYFINFVLASFSFTLFYLIIKKLLAKNNRQVFIVLFLFSLWPFTRVLSFKSSPINFYLPIILLTIYLIIRKNKQFVTKKIAKIFFPTLTVTLLMLTVLGFYSHHDPLLKDFGENTDSNVYTMVFAANSIIDKNLVPRSVLITAQNPFIFDNYSRGNYDLLPFSTEQEFFEDRQTVWGENNYDNLHELYQEKIDEGREVYFSNYLIEDFKDLRSRFSFAVDRLYCDEQCNIYRVEALKKLPEIIQPTTHNSQQFSENLKDNDFSFIVFGHTFETNAQSNNIEQPYYYTNYTSKLRKLLNHDSDFVVMMGDTVESFINEHQVYWDSYFANQLKSPLITVKDHDHKNNKTPDRQIYKIASSYFINLNLKTDTALNESEKIYLYNAIFDLENSDVKNVFIFNFEKLQDHTDFQKYIIPRLKELTDKKAYIVSGDNGVTNNPEFTQSMDNNIHYLATGFGNTTLNQAIRFSVEGEQVAISNFDL